MAKIINFPGTKPVEDAGDRDQVAHEAGHRGRQAVTVAWYVVALAWPVLRWVMALWVVWLGIKAMWYWHTPGTHAGLAFVAGFLAFAGLTYFVGAYEPTKETKGND